MVDEVNYLTTAIRALQKIAAETVDLAPDILWVLYDRDGIGMDGEEQEAFGMNAAQYELGQIARTALIHIGASWNNDYADTTAVEIAENDGAEFRQKGDIWWIKGRKKRRFTCKGDAARAYLTAEADALVD